MPKLFSPFYLLLIVPFALLDPYWQRGLLVAIMLICYVGLTRFREQVLLFFGAVSFIALSPTFASRSQWFGGGPLPLNRAFQAFVMIVLVLLVRQIYNIKLRLPDWSVGPIVFLFFIVATALLFVDPATVMFIEAIFIGMFFIFCKFIWVALLDLSAKRREAAPRISRQFLPYAFFAKNFFYMPIPFNDSLYDGLNDEKEISKNQLSGFCLFIQAIGVMLIIHVLTKNVDFDFAKFEFRHAALLQPQDWDLTVLFNDRAALDKLGTLSAWRLLYVHFVVKFAAYWANGNFVIAIFRLLGFGVFRNTYKVWRARSAFEYFQRFAYYFKELLARYFFYPAFFLLKGANVRLRLVVAIVYSVGIGNLLFHAMARVSSVGFAKGSHLADQWSSLRSYAIYCVLFSSIITISFFRNHWRKAPKDLPLGRHLIRLFFIFHIYILLQIFESDTYTELSAQIEFIHKLIGF